MRGRRVAGASAILWGPPGPDGERPIVARAVVALPGVEHAQTAEAEGCAAALDLLAKCEATLRATRATGDNLAVVRYCAAQGRLRRPQMQQTLAGRQAALHERGWDLSWAAARRRLNAEAERTATEGLLWAAERLAVGRLAPATWVVWALPPNTLP